MVGLKELLLERQEPVDLIVVAGDICDRADTAALQYAWRHMTDLATALGAQLVATAGNHDLDSRFNANPLEVDPKGALFDLDPAFPLPVEDSDVAARYRDHFWSRNYAVLAAERYRIVTLNSCAHHGYVVHPEKAEPPEYERGRVSPSTVRRLRTELEKTPGPPVNILVTHHHLNQLPTIDINENSVMVQAQELVKLLTDLGPWLVVHGHKHRPHIDYIGSGDGPIVFSAGSFAAYSSGELTERNQVYLLEFAGSETNAELGLPLAAQFCAWNWTPAGWQPASTDSELPAHGGFGWREGTDLLARRLVERCKDGSSLTREELLAWEPRLVYLAPEDVKRLQRKLAQVRPGIKLKRDESGSISQVVQSIELADNDNAEVAAT